MLLERPMLAHAGVSDDLALGYRASSGFSEAHSFEPSRHISEIGHPRLKPDAIIAVNCRPSPTTQFQTAESPRNSGRFSLSQQNSIRNPKTGTTESPSNASSRLVM
jgi:hypothetical protein